MSEIVFGLTEEDIQVFADFDFIKTDTSLFAKERVFGNAGGPNRIKLSAKGLEKALQFACQSRWTLTVAHHNALSLINASAGLKVVGLSRSTDEALRELSHVFVQDRSAESIAAGLDGDEVRYATIRDENRLVFLDQPQDGTAPTWKITKLGSGLLEAVNRISKAMIVRHKPMLNLSPSPENDEWDRFEYAGVVVDFEANDDRMAIFNIASHHPGQGNARKALAQLHDHYHSIHVEAVMDDSPSAISFWQKMLNEGVVESAVLTDGRRLIKAQSPVKAKKPVSGASLPGM